MTYRKPILALATLLLLAVAAQAQTLKLPADAKGDPGDFITIHAETDGATVRWVALDPGLRLFPTDLLKDTKTAVVIGTAPGRYRLLAYTAKADVPSDPAICVVQIGTPAPPVPPGPTPVPPGPAPIPDAGLRVLIVYETTDVMPPAQRLILTSQAVWDWLKAHCVKGPDGKTAEFRFWDKDVDTSAETPVWQGAMKRPRKSLPWVCISTGKDGYEGPLPATVDEFLTLVKKYGG